MNGNTISAPPMKASDDAGFHSEKENGLLLFLQLEYITEEVLFLRNSF